MKELFVFLLITYNLKKEPMNKEEEQIDRLVDVMQSIPLDGKITILTGSNGSGKSLIRKQILFEISRKTGKEKNKCVASTSLEARTSSNPEWGALSGIMQDDGWMPSSYETLKKVEAVLGLKDRYIIIDEPELGMGEETVMALVNYLNDLFSKLDESILGVMIITHNRYIVSNLKHDHFANTDGLKTSEEWLNRELIPTDLEILKENKLFFAIRDRQK